MGQHQAGVDALRIDGGAQAQAERIHPECGQIGDLMTISGKMYRRVQRVAAVPKPPIAVTLGELQHGFADENDPSHGMSPISDQ